MSKSYFLRVSESAVTCIFSIFDFSAESFFFFLLPSMRQVNGVQVPRGQVFEVVAFSVIVMYRGFLFIALTINLAVK